MLPKSFSVLVKPVGPLCNLHCTYCYYMDTEKLYTQRHGLMAPELVEQTIRETLEANQVPEVSFTWHGGEPLLAGMDFYRQVLGWQRKYNTKKQKISNAIQTNGTLLDDAWCQFFTRNGFLVGLSLDGPRDYHDTYRRNAAGQPSFDRVMRGLKLLKKHGTEFNTLSVVNNITSQHGAEIYNYFKSLGVQFMQFLPSVDQVDGHPAPWSVTAAAYGQFLIDIFDQWVVQDVGSVFVQLFDMTLAAWYGVDPPLCAYSETCGRAPAIERNGDVYSCDHFVRPACKLGNLREASLETLLNNPQQFQFGVDKRNTLSRECMACRWYFACRGECPKHRRLPTPDGAFKFDLCEGIKQYYQHVEPYMKYMCDLLKRELPPAHVMPFARVAMGTPSDK